MSFSVSKIERMREREIERERERERESERENIETGGTYEQSNDLRTKTELSS